MKARFGLVGRYTLLSLTLILGTLVVVGVVFDRFSHSLLERLMGERLKAQVAASGSRVSAFLDNRLYQLETLSHYPALGAYVLDPDSAAFDEINGLLRIEADVPDLYGILFFDAQGGLTHTVAGQAASGPPYWGRGEWSIDGVASTYRGTTEFIGPVLPTLGRPGWLLMRQHLRAHGPNAGGSVALHVRLASVTELLGNEALGGVARPLLRVPGGALLDATARPVTEPPELMSGPEILPGWRIEYALEAEQLLGPLHQARLGTYAAAGVAGIGILLLFASLSQSLRRRVERLVNGADALAAGDLNFRLPETGGRDEITAVSRAFNAMADRLREMIERTVQVEKLAALGEFATGVAHEVRNPLATIKVTVQALQRREADPERRELLGDVSGEIDRLNRVVNDLLAYGRPHPAALQRVPVRNLFRQAIALVRAQADQQQVRVTAQGDSRLDVYADPDQILQALVNLVANAIQACKPGGNVRLRVHKEGPNVRIEVTDDGMGIPPEVIERAFDPFFTTRPRGTGLGLSITRQLTQLNHGRLSLASEPGLGTTVSLWLPAADKNTESLAT